MIKGFWGKLDKPFTVLAPMANVTDWAFRQIIVKTGRPDVFYTEFLSCDGIVYDKNRFKNEMYFEDNERPIVIQFFGSKPENFYHCAQLAVELGFDGIDINMGCPDKSVEKQGAGAALIKNPELAIKIIQETIRGAEKIPVSVKTRIGYNKIETKEWITSITDTNIATLTVHGRTRKEMSSVPTHWDEIGIASEIAHGSGKYIIGNGDVQSLAEIKEKSSTYNLDGIMVGRGIFNNPWLFNKQQVNITPEKRIQLLLEHSKNFKKLWGTDPSSPSGQAKNFDTLKRFFKIYINGWPGAKDLRAQLMLAKNHEQVKKIILPYQGLS